MGNKIKTPAFHSKNRGLSSYWLRQPGCPLVNQPVLLTLSLEGRGYR